MKVPLALRSVLGLVTGRIILLAFEHRPIIRDHIAARFQGILEARAFVFEDVVSRVAFASHRSTSELSDYPGFKPFSDQAVSPFIAVRRRLAFYMRCRD